MIKNNMKTMKQDKNKMYSSGNKGVSFPLKAHLLSTFIFFRSPRNIPRYFTMSITLRLVLYELYGKS